ncbi:DNA repair protein rad51c [Rhizophlyctis rosea]|uniref:DNA repair protein rad51c n=1 Tax=Rhizophlyctis rosea TaxID=64517 RepID=A0AAD5S6Z1_9FUNG|nr:DNA repair protein rad51c [Rhizophlyctis rosea]
MRRSVVPRPIITLNIEEALCSKLLKAGYRTTSDIRLKDPKDLATDIGVSIEVVQDMLRQLKTEVAPVSALKALERERQRPTISTSSSALDHMLGGYGVSAGRVTEFCGPPGVGKTQLG